MKKKLTFFLSLILLFNIIYKPVQFVNAAGEAMPTQIPNVISLTDSDLDTVMELTYVESDFIMSESQDDRGTFKMVSKAELEEYDLSDLIYSETFTDVYEPEFYTRASYESKILTDQGIYTYDGTMHVVIDMSYTVWYYTDGKVHLYSRSITKTTTQEFANTTVTYGQAVNTDGSVSYTSGDKATMKKGSTVTSIYNIDFIVTSSYYSITATPQ